jgi:hypothetical protein
MMMQMSIVQGKERIPCRVGRFVQGTAQWLRQISVRVLGVKEARAGLLS